MIRNLMHSMVFLAFIVSTMPSLAVSMLADHQMMHQKMIEQVSSNDNSHQAFSDMKVDHSCCKDKKIADTKKEDDNKNCCEGDCQCMMNSCSKNQSLYNSSSISFTTIAKKLMFLAGNEHHDNAIAYLLKRPPKA